MKKTTSLGTDYRSTCATGMKSIGTKRAWALALLIGSVLAAGPVVADKPSKHGGKAGKHESQQDRQRNDDRRSEHSGRFDDRQRLAVHDYYVEQSRGGRCPPGLAKKHNGCMPPGQAKKWHVGRPLGRDVIFYTVPQSLAMQIGLPPSGHRYVRVATDILMIAIGSGMVIDAIADLGRS